MEPGVSVSAQKRAPFPRGGFRLGKLRLKGVASCPQRQNRSQRQRLPVWAADKPSRARPAGGSWRCEEHVRMRAGKVSLAGGKLPRQVAESGHSPQGPATRRRGRGLALTPGFPAPTGLVPPSCTLSRAARRPPHLLRSCSTGKGSATRFQAR